LDYLANVPQVLAYRAMDEDGFSMNIDHAIKTAMPFLAEDWSM
jgi:hypothetical protein